ncbi:MAG: hypothetical protein EZS28_004857 [Streblomastix strix]|uniref:Uncharacterized protein n=1 Tax=Streblomastix strix TaxID=222440 RepID=A0A5J4WX32_9EUKA|nr:MAG: hypothetical protein EZS28_004857 [Streblomastix strix]
MSKNQEKFLLASQKLFAVPNITPFVHEQIDLSFKQYDDKSLKKVKERALGEMELYRKSPLGQLFQQFYQHESEVLNKFIMSIMLYFQAFYEQRIFQNDMITMKDKKNPSLAAKKMIAHMRDPGREGRIKDCLDRYFMMASQAYFIVVIHACFAETHGQRYSDQVMQCFFKDLLDYTIYFCIEVIPSLREKGFDAEIRKELNNIMGSRMPQIGDKTMNADTDEGQSKLNASNQQQEQSGDLEVMMEKEKEKAKQREREKQQKKRAAEAHPLLDFAASNSPLLAVALANWSDDNQSNTSDNQQQNQSQNKANQNELTQKQSIDSNQQQLTPDHSESPSQSVYFNESYLDQMNWWNFKDLEIANVMKIADNAKRLMQGKKLKLFDEKDVDNQDQGLAEQDSDVIRRNKEVTNREQSPEGVNEENKTNQLQQSDNMNNTPPYQYEKNDMYIFRESHNLQRQYLKKKQGELNKLKKILSEKEYLKPIKPPFRTVENIINRANFFSPESDELTGRSGEEEMERMNIEYQRIVQTELEQMEVEKDIDKVALVERAWEKTEAEEKEALEMKKQQQILKNQSKVDSEFKSGDMDEELNAFKDLILEKPEWNHYQSKQIREVRDCLH